MGVSAPTSLPRAWRGSVVGILSLAAVTAIKLAFTAQIGRPTPFLLFFGAVLCSAWFGGTAPGLLTTLLAALLGNILFISPLYELTLAPGPIAQTLLFVLEGVLITLLTTRLQSERMRSSAVEERSRISLEWFQTALRSIGDAVVTTDRTGRITFLNPVAEELTGWKTAEAAGRPLSEIFRIYNETSREPIESPVERVLREGCVVGLANHTVLRRRDGSEVAIADSAAPIRADSGALVGVVLVFRNATRERREEERKSFLLRATAEMNSSLNYEETLATVARLLVPAMADWCAVDMLEGGVTKRVAVAHVDPEKVRYVTELERRYPPDPSAATGTPKVLRTGQPELIAELSQAQIDAQARDEEHLRLIRELALRSYIAAPIKYSGHRGHSGSTRGVLTLVCAESGRTYGPEDLEFATALAERAAIAIENALLLRAAQRLRAETAAQRD